MMKGTPSRPVTLGPIDGPPLSPYESFLRSLPPWLRHIVETHGREILAGVAVVLAAALLWSGYTAYRSMQENRGASALGAALLTPEGADRIEALSKVIQEHASTAASLQARLLLGAAYRAQGDAGKAKEVFQDVQKQAPDRSILAISATLGLASLEEDAGEYAKAADAYRVSASKGFSSAFLDLARVLAKSGDMSGARTAYSDFLAANPTAREKPFVEFEIRRMEDLEKTRNLNQ